MRLPIAVLQNHAESKECPFYCKDAQGEHGCVLKKIITMKTWQMATPEFDEQNLQEGYDIDCEGSFSACVFADSIWSDAIEEDYVQEEEEAVEIKVAIRKVDNPYLVKADVLVYPTNNLLTIDDRLLTKMSMGRIQNECDRILNKNSIKMGHVYVTSNGGDIANGPKAKQFYHAVVAGESRLVNDNDISTAIIKSLIMADDAGAEIVAMLPADCGSNPIDETAFVQLTAVADFLENIGVQNIKYIFIIMDDDLSHDMFIEHFSRIFSG